MAQHASLETLPQSERALGVRENITLTYYRDRWPDSEVPPGEPLWLLYEIDQDANVVLRTITIFPDGRVARNSIEIEERHGDVCPSLIDQPADMAFDEANLEEIPREEFEALYANGEDTPFWFID